MKLDLSQNWRNSPHAVLRTAIVRYARRLVFRLYYDGAVGVFLEFGRDFTAENFRDVFGLRPCAMTIEQSSFKASYDAGMQWIHFGEVQAGTSQVLRSSDYACSWLYGRSFGHVYLEDLLSAEELRAFKSELLLEICLNHSELASEKLEELLK